MSCHDTGKKRDLATVNEYFGIVPAKLVRPQCWSPPMYRRAASIATPPMEIIYFPSCARPYRIGVLHCIDCRLSDIRPVLHILRESGQKHTRSDTYKCSPPSSLKPLRRSAPHWRPHQQQKPLSTFFTDIWRFEGWAANVAIYKTWPPQLQKRKEKENYP